MKYLIAGLGNIGPEYAFTRHNIGFMAVDRLASVKEVSFTFNRLAYTAEIRHKGHQIFLLKPTTYMNLSGKAIRHYLQELKIPVENLLVIVDELQLNFGTLRLKPKGSHGGHNGLKNIEEMIATSEYSRLRVGVGNDFPKGRQVDYVLSPFDKDEMDELPELLDRAGEIILSFCASGVQNTMNIFNR